MWLEAMCREKAWDVFVFERMSFAISIDSLGLGTVSSRFQGTDAVLCLPNEGSVSTAGSQEP